MVGVALAKKPSWLDPYVASLSNGSLQTDGKETEKVRKMLAFFLAAQG